MRSVIVFLLVLQVPALSAQSLYQKIEQFRLDNGLLVTLIQADTASGIVNVTTHTRFGYSDDDLNTNGIAPVLKNAIFAGSKQYTADSLRIALNELGAFLEAAQSPAITSFSATADRSALEPLLQVMAASIIECRFSEPWIKAQLESVSASANPSDLSIEELNRLLADDFCMGSSDAPLASVLKSVTKAGVEELYHLYFSPVNTALVVSGSIDLVKTKEWVKTYFSLWSTRLPYSPALRKFDAQPIENQSYAWLQNPSAEYAVFRYLKAAPYSDAKDMLAFQLVLASLEDYLASDLNGRVAMAGVQVGVEFDPLLNNGLFALKVTASTENATKVDEWMKDALTKYYQRGADEAQLRQAKAILKGNYLQQDFLQLAFFFDPMIYSDLKKRKAYLQELQAVDVGAFASAFSKYADPAKFKCATTAIEDPFGANATPVKRYTLSDFRRAQ